jgi:hypothetical protein
MAGVALLIAGAFAAWQACGRENADCARRPIREWRGRVFTPDGRPADRATVVYQFYSNRPRELKLVTDSSGRYCLRWPHETTGAYVTAIGVGSAAPPDPRFQSRTAQAVRVVSPDMLGGPFARSSAWRRSQDAARGCASTSGPPWYRVEGLSGNWRAATVRYVAIACILWPLAVIVTPRARRRSAARIGLSLVGSDLILFVLVWLTKTI